MNHLISDVDMWLVLTGASPRRIKNLQALFSIDAITTKCRTEIYKSLYKTAKIPTKYTQTVNKKNSDIKIELNQ